VTRPKKSLQVKMKSGETVGEDSHEGRRIAGV